MCHIFTNIFIFTNAHPWYFKIYIDTLWLLHVLIMIEPSHDFVKDI